MRRSLPQPRELTLTKNLPLASFLTLNFDVLNNDHFDQEFVGLGLVDGMSCERVWVNI